MRSRRTLLATAICVVALTSGCASGGTANSGVAAVGTPASSASTATVSAPVSPTVSATASATASALPDGYDAKRDAAADIKAALALSATDHRQVLLDFGADWCPDCKVLDKLFRAPQVEPLLQRNYRVVAIDIGKFDHNVELATGYVDLQTSGVPALVVLGPDGSLRTATNDGAFSNARTMDAGQVAAFLTHWAPAGSQ